MNHSKILFSYNITARLLSLTLWLNEHATTTDFDIYLEEFGKAKDEGEGPLLWILSTHSFNEAIVLFEKLKTLSEVITKEDLVD